MNAFPPLTIGRLAPSPTGAQHVGNARTYLIAWLSARAQGGKVVLRMEDIDSPRVKSGAAEQIIYMPGPTGSMCRRALAW